MTPSTALAAFVLLVCARPSGQTQIIHLPPTATVESCKANLADDAHWVNFCAQRAIHPSECKELRDNTRAWCRCEAH